MLKPIAIWTLAAAALYALYLTLAGSDSSAGRDTLSPERASQASTPGDPTAGSGGASAADLRELEAPSDHPARTVSTDLVTQESGDADLLEQDDPGRMPAGNALVDWLMKHRPDLFEILPDGDLSQLTVLDLRSCQITDADLHWVAQLPNLKSLSLYGTPVTDAGLAYLVGLPHLESINLRGTQVTAAGLKLLPTQSLRHLHLCSSGIALDDLAHTPPMPAVETLKLNFLGFRDQDVESLQVYPSMQHLEIDDSRLTDAGLARLMELHPDLRRLEIRRSSVSSEAIAAIQRQYPECDIVAN